MMTTIQTYRKIAIGHWQGWGLKLAANKGQSLVETALVLPLILFLVLATIDIGLGFRTFMVLTNGARESVRWVSINPSDTPGAIARATGEAQRVGLEPGVLGSGGIVVGLSAPANGSAYVAGERVTATIDHNYPLMFGLFTQIPELRIRARATMVVLYNE